MNLRKFLAALATFSLTAASVTGAGAAMLVDDANLQVSGITDTGWQTFTHTFNESFAGTFGIGVSNAVDSNIASRLLIDRLSGMGPTGNRGFENGNLTGYNLFGAATDLGAQAAQVLPYSDPSYIFQVYGPTEGTFLVQLDASADTDTSQFLNSYYGIFGTTGTYLTFAVDVPGGETISFDWNFNAFDYVPFNDFAFVFWKDQEGVLNQETLATISTIPEPSTIFLLAAGIAGIGIARMRKKQS